MPGPNSLVVVVFFLLLFVFATTQAQVSHSTPRHQLKRRYRTSKSDGSSGVDKSVVRHYIPTYNWEQKEYVKAHNDLREESGVPPLQWHPDLANSSHNWANELQDTCNYRHHSQGSGYGENIFWSLYKEFTPMDVVKRWYSEKMHFDHSTNLCKCQPETDKCECGHYLNVVWKTTQWVGCSNAVYCKEAKGLIVVCQYDPPGNYKGVDPLNPQLPDNDDDGDEKGEEEEDHGVPPPPPPPPAINTNHGASGNNHRASGNNHRASIHPPPPPPPPMAINTNHGASGNNHRASIHPPPPPPRTTDNNHKVSRYHHHHHHRSPTSMNRPKVMEPSVIKGSIESYVTHHKHHMPKHKGGDVAVVD